MNTPKEIYFDLINRALTGDEEYVLNPGDNSLNLMNTTLKFKGPFLFDIASVGYSKARWFKFIREYTEPNSFTYFLSKLEKINGFKTIGYTCPVYARHAPGNCLLGFTACKYPRPTLHVYSRTSLLVPVGALDIMFISLIAQQFDAEVIWDISRLKIDPHKILPIVKKHKLKYNKSTPFIKAMLEYEKAIQGEAKNSWEQKRKFDRTNRALSRPIKNDIIKPEDLPDLMDYKNYEISHGEDGDVTPESLAKLAGVKGIDIRNYLRDEEQLRWWGSSHHYIGQNTYCWKTYSDPMVKRIIKKFNIIVR